MAGEGLPVQTASRVLLVSESGYYRWQRRPPSARSVRHAWLTEVIQAVHAEARYASRSRPGQSSTGRPEPPIELPCLTKLVPYQATFASSVW
ncbi:hypothetical protein [Catenulispora rubra]|uniref:hypothetical protein n=1 Tax=Catenulispora rubra TaxID=280293 RepID=UPI0018922EA2|nr:hypothetical protein [Catenulispora rubra]